MDDEPSPQTEARPPLLWLLFHPVSLLASVITVAVIALVAFSVFGWDKGRVLQSLAQYDFARGLITYIFGVGTIGLSVVLVVGTLLGGEEMKERFNRAKEVLALLLGIFGTMVGFYYGSELAAKTHDPYATRLTATPLALARAEVAAGGEVVLGTHVTGGQPPLQFRLGLDALAAGEPKLVPASGTVLEPLPIPATTTPGHHVIRLVIADGRGDSLHLSCDLRVNARGR